MLGFQEYTYLAHLLGFSINRCQATLHFGRGSKDKSELSAGGGVSLAVPSARLSPLGRRTCQDYR